jgi:hypothetical protein
MNSDSLKQTLIDRMDKSRQQKLPNYVYGLILIGVIGFALGIVRNESQRTFQAFLVNFVFWTGISQGAVLLSVVLRLTNAKWGRPIMRLAESAIAFLPISLLLFVVVIAGSNQLFKWMSEPMGYKAAWLNAPFLFTRVGFYLVLMTVMSLVYVRTSIRTDVGLLYDGKPLPDRFIKMLKNWKGADVEIKSTNDLQSKMAVAVAICYAVFYSLLAIDLVMSLDPHWTSTLFGAYFFIGCFYAGIALTIVMASFFIDMPEGEIVGSKQFHDLGKLLFGFAIVNGDFFYSQFLVIWYGNLPEETHYIIERTQHQPWATLAYLVLILAFVGPFIILINKKIKMMPKVIRWVALSVLLGIWLERTLLIAPSVVGGHSFPIGWIEISTTVGFLGLFLLAIQTFWNKYPMVAISNPLLKYSMEEHK